MLDKSREHSTIYGGTGTTRFVQDGHRYSASEKYLGKVGEEDRAIFKPKQPETVIIGDVLSRMDKKEMIALATSYGLKADGRMSEETLRDKIGKYNADILGANTEDS